MNVWLTPDLRPFTGGTYFPPRDAGRRPGLKTVLTRIMDQVSGLPSTRLVLAAPIRCSVLCV